MNRIVEVQIPEDQLNRIAANFIKQASTFSSYILISKDNNSVNAKSLLGFLSLGMVRGAHVELTAEGSDSAEALESLAKILEMRV
ncbi:MAG: HPr family phosphocarrier protein [Oscillibacter sp.]|mgnify:CR=1 FL=1|jgi:phosphotransferase system HPr (HPr) family protein|nr:HPr family phosphocarrier protein [Oscillibacter sp.]MCI9375670.1 HPr family phosphocarrier protein [Oscillibacter sp.]